MGLCKCVFACLSLCLSVYVSMCLCEVHTSLDVRSVRQQH